MIKSKEHNKPLCKIQIGFNPNVPISGHVIRDLVLLCFLLAFCFCHVGRSDDDADKNHETRRYRFQLANKLAAKEIK